MTDVVSALRMQLSDIVYEPGADEYVSATSPDNSSYRQQPCAVVRPRSAEQVVEAVKCAVQLGLTVAVQATGHGAGCTIGENQLLLDTSVLTDVRIDASARTARVEAGVMWPAVQRAAYAHGMLGLAGTSPTVGVLGYTFGGGVGWFVRKHGLASASLIAVEYVDGNGQMRCARSDSSDAVDREALWAFRGGAPMGVATAIEIALFPVPDLWTGCLLWPEETFPEVSAAWASAVEAVSESVSSTLSLLKLPPDGPFPDEVLGTTVVHLAYVSSEGAAQLDVMRDAVRGAAVPVVDTTAPGTLESLAAIHLDPPAAVPARGIGRWLGPDTTRVASSAFDAARVGKPEGLNMIELRHTDSRATGSEGALTTVPAPFLLHAVGAAADDGARTRVDAVLNKVEAACGPADIGRAATSFREGQPGVADAWSSSEQTRLRQLRNELDPQRVLGFQRDPV